MQEDLAPDSMVELMGDFIAVEPTGTGQSLPSSLRNVTNGCIDVERIHGIWCYEPEARESMCRKMEESVAASFAD